MTNQIDTSSSSSNNPHNKGSVDSAGITASTHPVVVGLGQGTVIRLTDINDPSGRRARAGANLCVDYQFVTRGKATRFQIRKRLQRLVVALLTKSIMGSSKENKWKKDTARHQRWMDKHLEFHPRARAGEYDGNQAS